MTATQTTAPAPTGRRRRVPSPVRHRPADTQDPPIYRDLLTLWADRGRTLPGQPDPEWARLAASGERNEQRKRSEQAERVERAEEVSGTPDPRDDGR
jgi:hypothetical protein